MKKTIILLITIPLLFGGIIYAAATIEDQANNKMIFMKISLGELINSIVLIITAIIVWKYTRAAQRSNEISERPILNLYLRKSEVSPNTETKFWLRNVGRGPAYNIRFDKIEANGYFYTPYIDEPNPILEQDRDEKTIDFHVRTPSNGTEMYDISGFQSMCHRLFPNNLDLNLHENRKRVSAIFLVNFEGVNNKHYYSVFRLYPRIWSLLDPRDLVVEFMEAGEGKCSKEKARQICITKETTKSVYEH